MKNTVLLLTLMLALGSLASPANGAEILGVLPENTYNNFMESGSTFYVGNNNNITGNLRFSRGWFEPTGRVQFRRLISELLLL